MTEHRAYGTSANRKGIEWYSSDYPSNKLLEI